MPNSRMRSKTAAATVLESDNPPITSPSAPMPTRRAEKNAVEERSTRLISLGIVTFTPETVAAIRRATVSPSSDSVHPTAAPVLRSPRPSVKFRSIGSLATHSSRASSIETIANRSGAVSVRSSTPTTV